MSYGDLDNDGDLDIVINNVNMPALLYKNNSNVDENKSISFELIGREKNKNAIGSKIIIKYGNNKQSMIENFPSRGFQSSIPNRLHFGVGNVKEIDSAIIYWPNNKVSYHANLETNKTHKIKQDFIQIRTDIIQGENEKTQINFLYLLINLHVRKLWDLIN